MRKIKYLYDSKKLFPKLGKVIFQVLHFFIIVYNFELLCIFLSEQGLLCLKSDTSGTGQKKDEKNLKKSCFFENLEKTVFQLSFG